MNNPSTLTRKIKYTDTKDNPVLEKLAAIIPGNIGQLEQLDSAGRREWIRKILAEITTSLSENKEFKVSEDKVVQITEETEDKFSNLLTKGNIDQKYFQDAIFNILTEALHDLFIGAAEHTINGHNTAPQVQDSAGTWSRLTQKALSIGLWGGSAYTSYIWGKEAFHESIVAEKLRPKFEPETMANMDMGTGMLAAFVMSQIIFRFKTRIIDICDEKDVGFWKGATMAFKEKPLKSFASLCVLTWSVGTNISGAFSVVGTEDERMKQLAYVNSQLDARTVAVSNTKHELLGLNREVDAAIQKLLRAEESGTDASGKKGRGPTFYAKEQLLNDSKATEGPTGNKKYAKIMRDILKYATGPDGKPLINDFKLTDELIYTVAEDFEELESMLTEIKMMRASITPDKEINELNADITGVVSLLAEAVKKRNVIEQKINDRIASYNGVLGDINTEAKKHFNSDSNASLNIEANFNSIDNSDLSIEEVKYRGPLDIAGFILDEYGELLGALILAFATILALSFDTGDLLTLPWERSSRRKDMETIKRGDLDKKVRKAQDHMANVIANHINSGVFANVFTTKNILPTEVRKSFDKVIEGIIHRNNKTGPLEYLKKRWRGIKRFWSTNTAPMYDLNAHIKALKEFQQNPKYIIELLQDILPGLHQVGYSIGQADQYKDLQGVIESNDEHLTACHPGSQVEIKPYKPLIVGEAYVLPFQYSNVAKISFNGTDCTNAVEPYVNVKNEPIQRREVSELVLPLTELYSAGIIKGGQESLKVDLVDIYGNTYTYDLPIDQSQFDGVVVQLEISAQETS